MIRQAALRDRLAEVLELSEVPDLTVYSRTPTGSISFPCVVIGMPGWKPRAEQGMDVWTWPIVVCVAMNASAPAAAVDELDTAWPAVADVLNQLILADQTIGGLCSDMVIESAVFGAVGIAGHDYPAQSINLKLFDI